VGVCWLRPADSSGPSGSGLEIRDAYYRVCWSSSGPTSRCSTSTTIQAAAAASRDWLSWSRRTTPTTRSGWLLRAPLPRETVCDHATNPRTTGDCPWAGRRRALTASRPSSIRSPPADIAGTGGWYRYSLRWILLRLEPSSRPSFGTYNTSCSARPTATRLLALRLRHQRRWETTPCPRSAAACPGPISQEGRAHWEEAASAGSS